MADFRTALKRSLESDPKLIKRGQKILDLLDAPKSKRRDRRITRLERHARAHLSLPSEVDIDWDTIQWADIIWTLLKFLLAVLPFILL